MTQLQSSAGRRFSQLIRCREVGIPLSAAPITTCALTPRPILK
jgi:hypothetical protein